MPQIKLPSIDVENLASQLPRPLQWPAGAVLGGLKSMLGSDDPQSAVTSLAAPMMAAEGPLMKGLGAVNPFMTAVGEEGAFNAGRTAPAASNPLEAIYERVLKSGAGNNQSMGSKVIGGASQEPHPAIRALMDTLSSQPEGMDPLKVFGQEKVGGFQVPHRTPFQVPEGFDLPSQTSPYPARDPGLIDAFAQRRDAGDMRASDYRPAGGLKPRKGVPGAIKQAAPGYESKFELSGLGGWKP